MDEKKTRRRRFEDQIPEDVREHARAAREHTRAAREELRASMKAFLPPGFLEHRRKTGKEILLAWRSLIDSAIERLDAKETDSQ